MARAWRVTVAWTRAWPHWQMQCDNVAHDNAPYTGSPLGSSSSSNPLWSVHVCVQVARAKHSALMHCMLCSLVPKLSRAFEPSFESQAVMIVMMVV